MLVAVIVTVIAPALVASGVPVITHESALLFSSALSPGGRPLAVQPSAWGAPPVLVNSTGSVGVLVVSVRASISVSTGAFMVGSVNGGTTRTVSLEV